MVVPFWLTLVSCSKYIECFEGVEPENNECTLVEFIVAIRSNELSIEEYDVLKRNLSDSMKGYIQDNLETCIREKLYGDVVP
jgi:hypothetical protein